MNSRCKTQVLTREEEGSSGLKWMDDIGQDGVAWRVVRDERCLGMFDCQSVENDVRNSLNVPYGLYFKPVKKCECGCNKVG